MKTPRSVYEFLNSIAPLPDHRHYANCHLLGVYSIVIGTNPCGGLRRLFVVNPQEKDPALHDLDKPFLLHRHAYDFVSTTLLGSQINTVARPSDHGREFHQYRFQSAISDTLGLEYVGPFHLEHVRNEYAGPGGSYRMTSDEIHRVRWFGCERTGWFACLINEYAPNPHVPPFVYCQQKIDGVPNAEQLYQQIDHFRAWGVLDTLMHRAREAWEQSEREG